MALKDKRDESSELHASSIQPPTESAFANHKPNHDEIRRRAYEIYLERGGLPGRELEDWLQAESEFESAALFMQAATGEKHRP
jgi:esterase/lipase superfamily enzyme